MSKIKDEIIKEQEFKQKELEANEPEFKCEYCQDTGVVEVMGGSDAEEWGVVGLRKCECRDE